MVWNKMKQVLESFLCPGLIGIMEYRPTGYRYLPDKNGRSYITVNKKEIFNMKDSTTLIRWYQSEQEIKSDPSIVIPISEAELEAVRKATGGKVPEDRLGVIARDRKITEYGKEMIGAQLALCKSDFANEANRFLTGSIESSLESKDILMNIFAIVDRRVGKKRLLGMEESMKLKHPIVQYFYELRKTTV